MSEEWLSAMMADPDLIVDKMEEIAALPLADWARIEGQIKTSWRSSGRTLRNFNALLKDARAALESEARSERANKRRREAEQAGVPVFVRGDAAEITTELDCLYDTDDRPCVADYGEVYRYDDESYVWRNLSDDELSVTVQSWAGAPVDKGNGEFRPLRIDSDVSPLRMFRRRIGQRSEPGFFDAAPPGVLFDNLALVVEDGDLKAVDPHPDLRALSRLPFEYNPDAAAPQWLYYLESTLPDGRAELLQEFVGAALCRIAYRYDRAAIVFGGPGTGKSTFLRVVDALFPRERRCSVSPHRMTEDYQVGKMAGAWLNVVYELPSGDVLAEDGFKAAVSGDVLSARMPYGQPFDFQARCAHLFACNALPNAPAAGRAFWERWLAVPFDQRFRNTPTQRRGLGDLIVESEIPAVAAWAVDGALRLLQNDGYTVPGMAEDALDEWREDASPIVAWSREALRDGGFEATATLYGKWKDWAKENGHHPLAKNTFGRRLSELHRSARQGGDRGFEVSFREAWQTQTPF